jgi:tetratricopeptide (TPR) repeat protein
LFAIHPLHVESVAWIAERKDVLSTLFWLLALWAWVPYAERESLARYLLVAFWFALGLMAKPMAVTLPFTLMLLDVWPLRRDVPLARRVWEKAPLFAMSIASAVVTYRVQRAGGAVQDLAAMPFADRVANAAVAYTAYLWKTVWPAGLAPFYPYSHTLPVWQVAASLLVLCGISVAAFRLRRRAPSVLFGWLWYVGTLVPVIGLVQVGGQAMADRYTYVPLIGVFVALAFAISGTIATVAATGAIVAALFVTRAQVARWSDSQTLFTHALAVTSDNWLAHNDLGLVLFEAGKTDEAIAHYTEALRIAPHYVEAHNNLGNALEKLGRRDEAIAHYRQALAARPDYARVHNNIGVALSGQGKVEEAIVEYGRALAIDPDYAKAHENLALALAGEGRLAEAIEHYEHALRTRPDSFETLNALGLALAKADRLAEAAGAFQKAVAIRPGSADARNNLAGALAALGRDDAAIEQLKEAVRLDPGNADARYNLESMLAAQKKRAGRP